MHEYWGRQRVLLSPNMRKYFDFFPGNGFSPCLGNGQKSALRAHRKYTVTSVLFDESKLKNLENNRNYGFSHLSGQEVK